MALRLPKRFCCSCVSPRTELIIWACISMSFSALFMFIMFFLMIMGCAIGGCGGLQDPMLLTFFLGLITDIVYNILITVASVRKSVKLLKISFYLGVAMWIALIVIIVLGFVYAPDELNIFLGIFIISIILRVYVLLILFGVRLQLQEDSQSDLYMNLEKSIQTERD